MNRYYLHREECLQYQKEYHALYRDKYKEYQKWYYQNVVKPSYVPKIRIKKEVVKKTKITKTFLKELEKVCKRKIDDYKQTLYHEQEAKKISNNVKAFEGFDVINGRFRLKF
jgi:hypothetical protein